MKNHPTGNHVFRQAKATAARRGIVLRRFVEDAVAEKLTSMVSNGWLGKLYLVCPFHPLKPLTRLDPDG